MGALQNKYAGAAGFAVEMRAYVALCGCAVVRLCGCAVVRSGNVCGVCNLPDAFSDTFVVPTPTHMLTPR
jgi:hypothetical protein